MKHELKPYVMATEFAVMSHKNAVLNLEAYQKHGQRHHIDAARRSHQQFREWRKKAIQSVQQYGTDSELDDILDTLDTLPRISPAAILLNEITGAEE
jgi:hypothetical protein